MLNACLRCSTIFAGFFTLIQALVWASFSIWGIAVYECNAPYPLKAEANANNFHDISTSYLFYVSYLRGKCRNPGLDYEAPSASRTFNILMAYSILSSIWVPTAVILLAGTCLGARGAKAKWIYVPWLIVSIVNLIMDIYATAVYASDISKTMTTSDYLKFLDISPTVQTALGLNITSSLSGYVLVPAIVMTILASRGILLWLLNFFFVAFGLQGICAFSKRSKPTVPIPYHQTQQFREQMKAQNEKQGSPLEGQWIDFRRPDPVPGNHLRPDKSPSNFGNHQLDGRINPAFVIDEPLRLDPVEVEVKQERNHFKEVRYAEVEAIEMEGALEEVHRIDQANDTIGSVSESESSRVSEAESALPLEEEAIEAMDVPNNSSPAGSNVLSSVAGSTQRRVYDAYGNPTEERLTPKVSRIQRIIEKQIAASQKGDLGGYNAKPFSYTQPMKPQVDIVPKKNDTVRGLEKPPIPVPDYSIRLTKKPSSRSPLPSTEHNNSTE